jgi:hypothetical protein
MSPDSSGILVNFSGNKDKKGIWNELILAGSQFGFRYLPMTVV